MVGVGVRLGCERGKVVSTSFVRASMQYAVTSAIEVSVSTHSGVCAAWFGLGLG